MSRRNPFVVLSSRTVYENAWIRVVDHRIQKPRGGEGVYGVVHFKNRAIAVVPYEDGHVWLVGQYRFPLGEYSWEVPEGGAPLDEPIEECARRELMEETGLRAGRLTKLFSMHMSNSISDELGHVFLATELSAGEPDPEDTEELEIKKLPLEEVYSLVEQGVITDSLTVSAIFRLMILKREGRL